MEDKEKDTKVLRAVRVFVTSLPLLLRLGLLFLKFKRLSKKRRKVFRKTLRKEDVPPEIVDKLVEDLHEVRLREIIKG